MQKTVSLRTLACGAALFVVATLSQAQTFNAGAPNCRFAVPVALGKGAAFWIGGCFSGHAEGPGVIRLQPKSGGAPHLFYGSLEEGIPQTGILQLAEDQWQPIWHFDANMNALENTGGNMQVTIDAFRAASKGAYEASIRYSAAGNKTSAAFYARMASRFDKQMNE